MTKSCTESKTRPETALRQEWKKRDISVETMILAALFLTAVKLLLAGSQLVYATPAAAMIDDTLMYDAARNITEGKWLGEYDCLTLGKHMFFPVWLAMLHVLHIPYLLGGQLLQAAAALCGAWAVSAVLPKKWQKLAAYGILLFNPAASAAEVQLRIYRDNITPALTLLFAAGIVGYALRIRKPLKKSIPFAVIGGIGFACSWLNREDGIWLVPFAAAAAIVTILFVLFEKGVLQKWEKAFCSLVPFAVLGIGICIFSAVNYHYYGRFVISDFTSREFNDAYGAMTRVVQENPQEKIPVPLDVRLKMYENVPSFGKLEQYLETPKLYNDFGSVEDREYFAGGFYWALRFAAQNAGFYSDAKTAQNYWQSVADGVNAACDSGALEAGRPHSGTMPRIRAGHIVPTLREGMTDFIRVLTFRQAEPVYWDKLSRELSFDESLRISYEDFLGNRTNWQAQEGSDLPYYSPVRQICYKLLNLIWLLFSVLTPVAFVWGLIRQCRVGAGIIRNLRRKQPVQNGMLWIIQTGLLLCCLLRCFIVAFMMVAAFNDVPDIMYLAGAYPFILLYIILGMGAEPEIER